MAKKPRLREEQIEVIYSKKQWALLHQLRSQSLEVMNALKHFNIDSITHGSIARGDVSEKSDIDIFIPNPPPSFLIETALDNTGFHPVSKLLVQATPSYAIKGHIELDERTTISFPLAKMRPIELGFYKFGGELTISKLESDIRVPGVDKRLMLIEPTQKGHIESTIIGREETVANLIGVKPDVVIDRVKALSRRDKIGRTGVFIKRQLSSDESFETVLKTLSKKTPALRRRLEFKQ